MAIANYFYNEIMRKYVAIFGTYFNQLKVERKDRNGNKIQEIIVPISYAPWQKILSRIEQDANLNRKSAINLPRMAFEITGITFDGERKIGQTKKIVKSDVNVDTGSRNFMYVGTPYNIEFSLYIMAKYSEDATILAEQIIPFFNPDFTSTVNLINGFEPVDIPLILNNITNEELYEGEYTERKSVLWTFNFTMKGWFFGPDRTRKVIKFMQTNVATTIPEDLNSANNVFNEAVIVRPGLTANNEPTTDLDQTIDFQDIDFDDNWASFDYVEENPTN